MTDDELAAVIAAFKLHRSRYAGEPAPDPASRWSIAVRMGARDARAAGLAQRAASRWALSERLRD